MFPSTRRILIGALLTGRSVAFNVPIAPFLSRHRGYIGFHTEATGINHVSSFRGRYQAKTSIRMMSSMQDTIERKLIEALSPVYLEVINESHMHSGPATESHFKVMCTLPYVMFSLLVVACLAPLLPLCGAVSHLQWPLDAHRRLPTRVVTFCLLALTCQVRRSSTGLVYPKLKIVRFALHGTVPRQTPLSMLFYGTAMLVRI